MGNKIKWIASLGLGLTILSGGLLIKNTSPTPTETHVSSSSYTLSPTRIGNTTPVQIAIQDSALSTALRNLLGKGPTDLFYTTDFLNHENFKATSITDEESGVTIVTSKTKQLDLSGTGVTDIRELCQFIFPETLEGINLASNGITEDNLELISSVVNAKNTKYDEELEKDIPCTMQYGERTLNINTNFFQLVKKINLNDNKINLSNATKYLSDTKFIFGLQNITDTHESGMILESEAKASYYIRESDFNYITFTIKYNLSVEEDSILPIIKDSVQQVFTENAFGTYSFDIHSIPKSATAYFAEYTYSKELTLFSAKIKDSYIVERGTDFILNIPDGKVTPDSNIEVLGLGSDFTVSYEPTYTNHITITSPSNPYTNKAWVTITDDNGASRRLHLEFIVNDTIAPVIKLKGPSYMLSSRNKVFNDPGTIEYDPITPNGTSGDDIDPPIISSTVDYKNLGIYTITYTVSDLKGNTSSVTRTVEIVERALDTITLSTTSTDIKKGDDVTLIVQPNIGTPIDNYSDLVYYFYIDGKLFETKSADKNGNGIITIIADKSYNGDITVKLTGKIKASNLDVELYSNTLNLNISIHGDNTITLATTIAIGGILLVIIIVTLLKIKKKKGNTHSKQKPSSKKKKEEKKDTSSDIQVIKNFSGASGTSEYKPPVEEKPKTEEPTPPQEPPKSSPPNPFDF